MSIKKIFKAVVIITIFSVLTRILGFFFRIYLSRQLTPTNLGIYQIAASVFGIFCALVSSGLPLVISRKTAEFEVEKNKAKEHGFMLASLIVGLLISLVCCLLIVFCKKPLLFFLKSGQIYTLLVILMPAIIFSSIYSIFRGNLWGHKNYFWVCFIELVEQVVRILVCFIFLSKISDAVGKTNATALSLSIACVISGIMSIVIYFVLGGKLKSPKTHYKSILKSSTPITLMRVLQSLIQPLITIVVPLRLIASGMQQTAALAEIGIVMGMTFPLLFVPSAIVGSLATALIPEISAQQFQGNKKELANQINSALSFSLVCSFVLVPIYMALGSKIGTFVFNNAQSGVYLAFSSFLMIPICLNTIASSALNSLGMETKSFKNYIVGSVLMLLVIWFLPKYIGVYALSLGMGICLLSCSVLNINLIKKKIDCPISLNKQILQLIIISSFLIYLTKFSFGILIKFCPIFISLALSSIICFVCFLILLDTFNVIKIFNVFVHFKRKIFKKSKSS